MIFSSQPIERSPFLFRPLAFVVAAILWAMVAASPVAAELVDRVVAVVNDDIILLSELDRDLVPFREKLVHSGYDQDRVQQMMIPIRDKLLKQKIDQLLVDQQIKKHQISVGEQDIDQTIARIKQFNGFSDDQFVQALEQQGTNLADYRQQVKGEILRSRLVNLEVKSKIVITDEDIQEYYDQHQGLYAGKQQYHLRRIFMRIPQNAGSDERKEIKARMQRIHAKVNAGGDFSELARTYSESSLAAEGGDLGLLSGDDLSKQVRSALKGLKAGQATGILETEKGFQVFYIEAVQSLGGKTLDEARPEIEDKLFKKVVDEKYQTWIDQLRQRAHVRVID